MNNKHISREQLLEFVRAGISAPSPDNMQPWKFSINEDSLGLHLDRSQMGHFFDDKDVATLMGCGALIENIVLIAQARGLATTVEPFPGAPDHIATLSFCASEKIDQDALAEAVFQRHTDRGLYRRSKPVSEQARQGLATAVIDEANYDVQFCMSPSARKAVIHAVTEADRIRFNHPEVHRDFYSVLRFGDSAAKKKDGLADTTLGVERIFIPILRLLRPWGLTQALNHIGLHRLMALRGAWLPMVSTPCLAAIVEHGPSDPLLAGRAVQRVWLQATRLGLSVQPLGALPLFLARLHQSHGSGFNEPQIQRLQEAEERLASTIPGLTRGESRIVMLFRIGYSSQPAQRSWRRDPDSFLL